jgi:hypothetical protein
LSLDSAKLNYPATTKKTEGVLADALPRFKSIGCFKIISILALDE